jgi:ATP-dependent helicase/nuclease subunit B
MSVRFILGRSGTGKTKFLLDEMTNQLMENPSGRPIIYLVPEQMTFLSEYTLVNTPGLNGMMRAQVYSFSRLAWKVLQETGGLSRIHLSSAGLNMLIRKIIEERKENLRLFSKAADKAGFIQHVEKTLIELKRYCVGTDELAAKRAQFEENGEAQLLVDKLHDLHLIYKEFENHIVDRYIASEDYFQLLAESIQKSEYLQGAQIYVDGFYSFTPQEYMVISELMKSADQVSIALTLDRPYSEELPEETDLFRMTGETYASLSEMARGLGISTENVLMTEYVRSKDQSLVHLERFFEQRPAEPYIGESTPVIYEASNRRAEIEGVAREIRRLVREHHQRYKEIAVLVRNAEDYQELIETVFYDYEIPFFIDQKRTMLNHPFIELIRSSLEILTSHWRYEPVFRAVKTELLYPLKRNTVEIREKMDLLENYCLAYGVKGELWAAKKRWIYRRYRGLELTDAPQTDEERATEEEINELRDMVRTPILRLHRRFRQAKNGRDFCEALYRYFEELDIPAKLERLSREAEENGDLLAAREHEQAWNAVIGLLDQFVEMLGDEPFTLKKFATVIEAGIESMRFTNVPPSADQVIIANLELSRLSDIKTAFIIGVNDGVLPAKLTEEGILTDEERERMASSGMKLAPTSKMRLLNEEFIAYKAFTTPSERLYISYPIANEEGKALLPSLYIKRMKEIFPDIKEQVWLNDPSQLKEKDQLSYISHPRTAISYLTAQFQLKLRNYPMYSIWWDVYNFYMNHQDWKRTARKILSSLFYRNEAKNLTEETSKKLYGDHILASVSRMELFHGCPFSHFAKFGLGLREREVFRLEAPDIGELFHGALKWMADEVKKRGIGWRELTKDQCMELAREAVQYLAPKLQNQILLSSNRHYYIKRKLESIIGKASYILSEHSRASGFEPVGLELGFGPKSELPPFTFTLKNGVKMELAGRIDRVDKAEENKNIFLRVIDYKSSSRDLDLTEVYYGLALQMLTYLDIVLANSSQLIGTSAFPAGVLYFHIHNPIVKAKKMLTLDEIEEEIFKQYKMRGLVLNDPNVIRLMDQTLETGNSAIISAGLKKDGTLTSRSKAATDEEFESLRKYVRKFYEKTGNEIVSGRIDIAPYKYKKKTPCEFCSYRSLCQFDPSFEENRYRIITPLKDEDVLNLIRERGEE